MKYFNVTVEQKTYYVGTVKAESYKEATRIVRDKLKYGYEDVLRLDDTIEEELLIDEVPSESVLYNGPDLSEEK